MILNFRSYFFLGVGLVCDNALPATDVLLELVLPSLKIEEAFVAIAFDVCFLLVFAMYITSLHGIVVIRTHAILIFHCIELKQIFRTEGILE